MRVVFRFFFNILLLFRIGYILCENHLIYYANVCESDALYFDVVSLSCRACGEGQTSSADGLSCVCRFGYKLVDHSHGGKIVCEPCTKNELSSNCAVCEFESDTTNSSDVCHSCGPGQIGMVRDVNGSFFNSHQCVSCQPGTEISSSGDRCLPCIEHMLRTGLNSCDCPEAKHLMTGGVCFKISDLREITDRASLYTVKYHNEDVESSFFCSHARAAAALCQVHFNQTACQLLANLCVLSMYRRGSDGHDVCGLYLRAASVSRSDAAVSAVFSAQQRASHVPWLYYQFESVEDTLRKKDVEATYSFKKKNASSRLNLTSATYSADGRFLGLKPVSGRTWQLCGGPFGVLDRALDYGTRYSRKCRIPVKDLLEKADKLFYDPYLYYDVPGKMPVLYAIPVLIRNYLENGLPVNRGPSSHWKLVRRFFLVDNVSGVSPCNAQSRVPMLIKYAKDITIRIEMFRSAGEASNIYPPLVIVEYAEVDLRAQNLDGDVEVSFSVIYEMDQDKEQRDYSIAIGVLTAVGVLYALIQTWSWSKRSGRLAIDLLALIKFLLYCCGRLSTIFFTVTFATCLYILFFFKRQDVVYVVLPTPHQETIFVVMIVVAFSLKAIDLIHVLASQAVVDIFFVDWENPRPRRSIPHPMDSSPPQEDSVSIWRTYLVANEWAELQVMRKTSVPVQLFSTLFLLKIVGLENLASSDPSSSVSDLESEYHSPHSTVCRMALAIAIYLAVAVIQSFFVTYVLERFVDDKIKQFIDLCSISNISVFIMTHHQFGHYIHGRSVHGHADTDMKSMREQLRREEENLCSQRGLLANSDQQTFYMSLPAKLRAYYDHVMAPLLYTNQIPGRLATSASPTRGNAGANILTSSDCSNHAYQTMNKFLASFLEHALRDIDYVVKDRLFAENLLDIEFQDPTDKGFFYIDTGHSYDAALLCGQETTLIMFDMLLFVCIDLAAKDFILASVVTFVVSKIIVSLYRFVCHRNLARKTLVDSRFLI